ncbi:MAG: NADH-quinone oxidoreductase subunit NuoF [Phycisphaerales bacterium]|jgi:NADH:ubiquinone oxidoreductase subunit F (NADH-binding)/(2Fe-2S) ferredoxin/NAD-dependent dihydropyrimidine dehydrogenase PreA subunit|nr:NADH-quinone oxidoreductase subunit NuoF [Phycisphaerales bacterium]MBT7170597.1 NADH-quinone oxidoreductase subunit NuoF [Phycisphaerales bacterium]
MSTESLIQIWAERIAHYTPEVRESLATKIAQSETTQAEKAVIYLGAGTCGLGAGAGKTLTAIQAYLAEKSVEAEIVETGCIGLCAVEPMMDVQLPGKARVCYQNITAGKVETVLDGAFADAPVAEDVFGQFRQDGRANYDALPYMDEHPFFAPQTRWVLKNCGVINPGSIEDYIASGGYAAMAKTLMDKTPVDVCEDVLGSGLRGRGGGGFPTGRKWQFAQGQAAEQKYLVCNADEGDPGAFMDRAVIEGDPHRLLEGMVLASYAIGATKAYIYIRAEYPLAIARLEVAIEQAKQYGLLGENILDSGMSLDIVIKKGAGAFVCGEETALIHSIEGKRGMPRPRPPFPAVKGLFGKPTIINNVETLANLPAILANGPEWFATVGTEGSKGTKVFALSGNVKLTGLVEVAMGTTVREIVYNIGGGIEDDKAYKSTQIGGPSGGCIPEQHLDIEVDYESLKTVGAMMGSGGLVVMDEETCMVDVAKFFMDFIQRESCGKCIPCREGTRRMLETLERLTSSTRGEGKNDALRRFQSVMLLERQAKVIQDTSLCGLGQTAPNPVLSTLNFFRDEYEAHLYERKCPAGVCSDLIDYRIIEDKCIGCTACARKCPTDAIMGAVKSPHYIISDKCIACGACFDACKFDAVIKE